MMSRAIFAFLTLLCACVCESYHILVLFPFPGKSHSILGNSHVKYLLEAGHEVTHVTSFPMKIANPRLHTVDLSDNLKILNVGEFLNIKNILDKTMDPEDFTMFTQLLADINNLTFHNPNMQSFLNDDKQKIDAVIVEWMFSEASAAYAAYFEAPYIYFTSTEPHSLSLSLIDEAPSTAYHPTISSSNMPPFTFMQRVKELVLYTVKQYFFSMGDSAFYEKAIAPLIAKKGRVPPSFNEIRYNASLILGNSHVSLGSAIRLPQSYKPIGGFHIDTDVSPLPEGLKKVLDSSKNGVIYFSMGSNLKSKELPNSIKIDLLKLFGSLKQTVIWKFEEVLPNLPENVHILQWAPQQSILAHSNTILFITHGGLLSTAETIHFGVPVIGIPVFADQFSNVDTSTKKGFALRVDLTYNLGADLEVAINKILGDPKYSQKAKELSLVYHDRPVPPGKELVHWVEHVIKTRGAPHLRSPALCVPWYQKAYLDLAAVVLVAIIIIKKLITSLCCRKKVDLKKKLN